MPEKYILLIQPKTTPSQKQIQEELAWLTGKKIRLGNIAPAKNNGEVVVFEQISEIPTLEQLKEIVKQSSISELFDLTKMTLFEDGQLFYWNGDTGKITALTLPSNGEIIVYNDGISPPWEFKTYQKVIFNSQPISGVQDGSNKTFGTPSFRPGSLCVTVSTRYKNGVDFTENGSSNGFTFATFAPTSDDQIIIDFIEP